MNRRARFECLPLSNEILAKLVQGARDEPPLQFSVHIFTQETDKARKGRKESQASSVLNVLFKFKETLKLSRERLRLAQDGVIPSNCKQD